MPANNLGPILLSSAVAAAFVTSIINLAIAFLNNSRGKSLEHLKAKKEINIYRYSQLHDILRKWHDYDGPFESANKSESEIARERLFKSFFDNSERFKIAAPLLDESYRRKIKELEARGNELLHEIIAIEKDFGIKQEDTLKKYQDLNQEFLDNTVQYSTELIKAIQGQCNSLLENIL